MTGITSPTYTQAPEELHLHATALSRGVEGEEGGEVELEWQGLELSV